MATGHGIGGRVIRDGRRDAVKAHARFHPQRVRFEIRYDTGDIRIDLRPVTPLAQDSAQNFQRQIVRCEHDIRAKLDEFLHELRRHDTG